MNKKKIFLILIPVLVAFTDCTHAQNTNGIEAALGKLSLRFNLDVNGKPIYSVQFDHRDIILSSPLGFSLSDDSLFDRNFSLLGSEKHIVDENWVTVWGETKNIRNHYNQLTIHLQHKKSPARLLDIVFRIFEDGVGFRYEFPSQPDLQYFVVRSEATHFNLAGDAKAFWIPGDYDTNEYPYTTSLLSQVDNKELVENSTAIAVRVAPDRYAVQTPLMLKTQDGLYINIHEASLINYPAMQLHVNGQLNELSARLVPDAVGNCAYLHAPFHTPWRTIIVSNRATDILSSRLILNLNDPDTIKNTSWIKPMKFVGVWWEMQTGKSTWSYSDYPDSTDAAGNLIPNKTHGANTKNVKRYIDFAAANGIQAVLVEGWNTGWEDWFGKWKENVFDFVTPYPDFKVDELRSYANDRGVQIIMHNETSGSATNYERQMDTAFRFMIEHGYHAVKTGYVGKIIPRGEHHDGQWMINHYLRVIQKAAGYHIMVDAHEPVRPTGLHRTYPNFMASEAARGNEYNAFSFGNMPEHETILPFTRLMGGPMDYTPGIFKITGYSSDTSRRIHTTLAKQLALYVTLYSPIQMAADYPENYAAHMDAFQFIKDVPTDWDETRVLAAEPGDYIMMARKARNGQSWFLGAITDEQPRELNIDFSFLEPGKEYEAIFYEDTDQSDWLKNPESYQIKKVKINLKSHIKVKLAPGGGAAVSIKPV